MDAFAVAHNLGATGITLIGHQLKYIATHMYLRLLDKSKTCIWK